MQLPGLVPKSETVDAVQNRRMPGCLHSFGRLSTMRKLAIRRVGQCRAHLSMVDCQTDRTYGDRSESLVT
jgi:hypothetical protein